MIIRARPQAGQRGIYNIPTYPAPTQQMFFTPTLCLAPITASRDVLLVLCFPRPEAASSNASCSFNACRTGLKVKLPSGVVGAVEISWRASSESTLDEGIERFRYMLAFMMLEVEGHVVLGCCALIVSGGYHAVPRTTDLKPEPSCRDLCWGNVFDALQSNLR